MAPTYRLAASELRGNGLQVRQRDVVTAGLTRTLTPNELDSISQQVLTGVHNLIVDVGRTTVDETIPALISSLNNTFGVMLEEDLGRIDPMADPHTFVKVVDARNVFLPLLVKQCTLLERSFDELKITLRSRRKTDVANPPSLVTHIEPDGYIQAKRQQRSFGERVQSFRR
jgi:hypothetical protein